MSRTQNRLRLLALSLVAATWMSSSALAQPGDDDDEEATVLDATVVSDKVELERVKAEYQAGAFGECAKKLGELLDPDGSRPLRDRDVMFDARVYRAACLMGDSRAEEADQDLRQAVQLRPTQEFPDRRIFPPELVDRYIQVRLRYMDEVQVAIDQKTKEEEAKRRAEAARRAREAKRVRDLERYAEERSVTETNSRWIAGIPFGVGQFQNRSQVLGWVFLSAEALLAATSLTTLVLEIRLRREAIALESEGQTLEVESLNADTARLATAQTVSTWGLLTVAAVGVLEAQLSFVPSFTEVRREPLPDRLRPIKTGFTPYVGPTRGGASLGVFGRF